MVARPKRSIKKTLRKVVDSLKNAGPKINPDAVRTGPRRRAPKKVTEAQKNLKLLQKLQDKLKNRKKPKVSDLLYRPKRDKYGNIIKPRPKNPKLPKDRKPPVAMPMKSRKPKKS